MLNSLSQYHRPMILGEFFIYSLKTAMEYFIPKSDVIFEEEIKKAVLLPTFAIRKE